VSTTAPPRDPRATGEPRRRATSPLVWPLLALALLLLFNLIDDPRFFQIAVKNGRLYGSLVDVVHRGTPVMLVALGMTLVLATGGVDLSVGAVMAITGALAALLITQYHAPLWMIVLAPLCAGIIGGLWNGFLVAFLDIQPFVATLILMVAGRGIAQLITNGQILTFEHKPFEFIAGGNLFGVPFTFTIVAAAALITWLLTRRTAIGLFIESVGNNMRAARYAGINVTLVLVAVYAFSGLMSGAAGLIPVSDIKGADSNNAGMYIEMDAILATVIGGTAMTGGKFNLLGTIVGALIIQTLTTTILSKGVPVELTLVVKSLVVLAVCLLQSEAFRQRLSLRRARRAGA
jgi:simple sugar transport system permease protein